MSSDPRGYILYCRHTLERSFPLRQHDLSLGQFTHHRRRHLYGYEAPAAPNERCADYKYCYLVICLSAYCCFSFILSTARTLSSGPSPFSSLDLVEISWGERLEYGPFHVQWDVKPRSIRSGVVREHGKYVCDQWRFYVGARSTGPSPKSCPGPPN